MAGDHLIAHGVLIDLGRGVLLLRRAPGRYLGGQWDVPMGTVEPGASPEQAAERVPGGGRHCCPDRIGDQPAGELGNQREAHPVHDRNLPHAAQGPVDVTLSQVHDDFRWAGLAEASELALVWHLPSTLERCLLALNRSLSAW